MCELKTQTHKRLTIAASPALCFSGRRGARRRAVRRLPDVPQVLHVRARRDVVPLLHHVLLPLLQVSSP